MVKEGLTNNVFTLIEQNCKRVNISCSIGAPLKTLHTEDQVLVGLVTTLKLQKK
jgi:hypothetical protein